MTTAPAAKKSAKKATAKTITPAPVAIRGTDYAPHWSPFQLAIFEHVRFSSGSAIVQAVAGSGKTTTIAQAIRYMAGEIVALAFNRAIAKELESRLFGVPNVTAGTVHKLGLGALKSAFPDYWIKVDGDKLKWLFNDHLKTDTNWLAQGNVCKLCNMAKDAGAGIDFPANDLQAWQDLAAHFSIPLFQESKKGDEKFDIVATAQKLLKLSNEDIKAVPPKGKKRGYTVFRIDFSDMIYLPVLLNLEMKKFDWVVVDEAQDLNLTRRLFIKAISKDTARHLIVGDTAQAIYGFTGADANSMANMQSTFACAPFPLSVSYRCASAIIEHAQTWMPNIEAKANAPLGVVYDHDYINAMENKAETFTCDDVILCRNNAPLVKTAMEFIRANIPVKIEGNDLTSQLVTLATECKHANLLTLRESVIVWGEESTAKALEKGRNQKAGAVNDLCETLLVFVDRAIEMKMTFEEMVSMIKGFFAEDWQGEKRQLLTLSTIHKSKGREWNRVFWLGLLEFQPSKFAKLPWEIEQETNLCYVAATRAINELCHLTGYPVPSKE
jgi:superfamily I DNA/RNA helicase